MNENSRDNWTAEKPYITKQLDALRESMDSMAEKLGEIETELRAYKRAAQFLIALGSAVGLILGWFAKAIGKA